MRLLSQAFSDQQWDIHDVIADDDKVVIRCTHTRKHAGDFFGIPASGRRFAYEQMHVVRVVNGSDKARHTLLV